MYHLQPERWHNTDLLGKHALKNSIGVRNTIQLFFGGCRPSFALISPRPLTPCKNNRPIFSHCLKWHRIENACISQTVSHIKYESAITDYVAVCFCYTPRCTDAGYMRLCRVCRTQQALKTQSENAVLKYSRCPELFHARIRT